MTTATALAVLAALVAMASAQAAGECQSDVDCGRGNYCAKTLDESGRSPRLSRTGTYMQKPLRWERCGAPELGLSAFCCKKKQSCTIPAGQRWGLCLLPGDGYPDGDTTQRTTTRKITTRRPSSTTRRPTTVAPTATQQVTRWRESPKGIRKANKRAKLAGKKP